MSSMNWGRLTRMDLRVWKTSTSWSLCILSNIRLMPQNKPLFLAPFLSNTIQKSSNMLKFSKITSEISKFDSGYQHAVDCDWSFAILLHPIVNHLNDLYHGVQVTRHNLPLCPGLQLELFDCTLFFLFTEKKGSI